MSADEPRRDDEDAAVRNYTFICFAALILVLFVLLRRGMGHWGLVPVGVGMLGVTLRWRLAPLVTLVLVALFLSAYDPRAESRQQARDLLYPLDHRFDLADWLVSVGMLAFAAAHYRLQALTHTVFPVDPRRVAKRKKAATSGPGVVPPAEEPRPARLVTAAEVGWLVGAVPLWATAAYLVWRLLPVRLRAYGLSAMFWQGVVFTWGLGVVLIVVAAVLGYVGWRRMSRREAALVLQDTLWQETRRDQRRLQLWLAWDWLRRRRKS